MQNADALLDVYQKRRAAGLPLERVYRHLFDSELFLRAYGKVYRNAGAMTEGATEETVDGMSLRKVHAIIELLRHERYAWTPIRRVEITKANGRTRPLGIQTWSDKLLQEAVRTLLRARLQALRDVLYRGRYRPLPKQVEWLGRVVERYFLYFAIPGKIPALESFRTQVVRYWLKALCRRGQKHRLTWDVFGPLVRLLIPHPRVLHPHPNDRFYAKHPK
jgi:hypothetical protein